MIFIDYFSHLGRLIAHGSSYFLKKTFGIGYYLHINLSTKNYYTLDSNSNHIIQIPLEDIAIANKVDNCVTNIESSDNEWQKMEKKTSLESCMNEHQKKIHHFVMKWIENASIIDYVGTVMTFSIPNNQCTISYEGFFDQIEIHKENLGKLI